MGTPKENCPLAHPPLESKIQRILLNIRYSDFYHHLCVKVLKNSLINNDFISKIRLFTIVEST
jgi:hypothetical protein